MLSSTAHEVDDADGPADKLQPTYSDNKPIKWVKGSNPAHLPGILYELERFYIRKGLFQPLFENNAVVCKATMSGGEEQTVGDLVPPGRAEHSERLRRASRNLDDTGRRCTSKTSYYSS